nr:kelch repeat-containing protein [Myxococcus sp. RHSTA-1-4]
MVVACGQQKDSGGGSEASSLASQESRAVTTSPTYIRTGATLTLLTNGKVLLAGGTTNGAPPDFRHCELYTPGASSPWSATGPLVTARHDHAATRLQNGKVLVSGGITADGDSRKAELYDPTTGTWAPTGSLNVARARHTQTLLPNGKVLVVGGDNPTTTRGLASAELYDPATDQWTLAAAPSFAYSGHTATLLKQGTVLVLGNRPQHELYNPSTNTWSLTANSPGTVATGHTATLLSQTPEGIVLVVGPAWTGDVASQAVWRYTPTTNSWDSVSSASSSWWPQLSRGHQAVELNNGTVLVLGGADPTQGTPRSEVRLYSPWSNLWTYAPALALARRDSQVVLVGSSPDQMLITGGWGRDSNEAWVRQQTELYSTGCVPQTCATRGAQCGSISDWCGGVLECGTCSSGTTCGSNNTCESSCVPPLDTCDNQCGCVVDACGELVDCGACESPCPAGQVRCCGVCMIGEECDSTACAMAPQLVAPSPASCF